MSAVQTSDVQKTETTTGRARGTIVLERTYAAAAEELWELWTTKDGFASWWGPQGFRVEVQELDARVGGIIRYDMIADAPEQIAAMKEMGQPLSHGTHGTFTELRPHVRLAITHVIDFLPGVAPYENKATVDLVPSGSGTRMVITVDALHDAEWTKNATEGWASQITKLDARFRRLDA